MSKLQVLTYALEAIITVAAITMLFVRNILHAALLAVAILLCLAGIYFVAGMQWLGVTQILVYAGGILVLVLFGIMLTVRISGRSLNIENQYITGAAMVGVVMVALLLVLIPTNSGFADSQLTSYSTSLPAAGIMIVTDYLLPFEIAGLLLLVALVGATMITELIKARNP